MTHPTDEEMRRAGMGKRPDGHWQFGFKEGDPAPHQIRMSDARDPAKYQAAKAEAEEAGQQLEIVPDDPPPPADDDAQQSNFTAPEPVRITRAQAMDHDVYTQARAQAHAANVKLEILD